MAVLETNLILLSRLPEVKKRRGSMNRRELDEVGYRMKNILLTAGAPTKI